jgi:hypothetical protein
VADPDGTPRRTWTTRSAERRAALARQTWSDFLRDLAVRIAIVAAVVIVLAVVVWLLRG